MLKIKDGVDIRKIRHKLEENYIRILGRDIFLDYRDDYYIRKKQLDTLYDLIKADLVEKVD